MTTGGRPRSCSRTAGRTCTVTTWCRKCKDRTAARSRWRCRLSAWCWNCTKGRTMDNPNNQSPHSGSTAQEPPLRCRIWKNPMVQIPDRPEMTPYTIGVAWRDGMVREASFSIDENKLTELTGQQGRAVSREGLIFHMLSSAIEQIFASREYARLAAKAGRIIVPGRFQR